MDDLVTWLRRQLDEDERVALATCGGVPYPDDAWRFDGSSSFGPKVIVGTDAEHDAWSREGNMSIWTCDDEEDGCPDLARQWSAEGEHIALHDPARVLRDVARDRLILDEYGKAIDRRAQHPGDVASAGALLALLRVIKLLALPYSDRPGYREEWRP